MTNPHGSWIWYELLTNDAPAALDFYTRVVGWTPTKFEGAPSDYTILNAGGEGLGGVMPNPMPTPPAWLGYIGVDDVDAMVAKIESLGGKVHMPPTTMEQVGRMALVEDPQGVKFYVMRGESPEASKAYDRRGMGKASWNELSTTDDAAALQFYGEVFGWQKDGAMPMPWGDYSFLRGASDAEVWGAMMPRENEGQPIGWGFYFRVGQIDEAKARIEQGGGTVRAGPMEVPGGEWVVMATDPQGAAFGLVGTK
ncbi:MAG: VOC family protein [Sphingomonas sp.]|uniref:VOC family protein n=1 Tax=Sphingomonas sp. TaxID=28214 RepID=UPI001B0947F8|nr:VOC family protein [Sphingomonas sp.]MBO9621291.1 VOC family protein [Sphingomonas sp.]